MKKLLAKALLVVAVAGSITFYLYQNGDLTIFAKPCSRPISYSIGKFDTGFGVSQPQFLDALDKAAALWETAAGKNLFEYTASNGSLQVNLIYDNRQQTTEKLKSLGITISDSKASYDSLKQRYNTMLAEYNADKKSYETKMASYNRQKALYEQTVNYWNSRGGAPKNVATQLNTQADQLNTQANQLNQQRLDINTEIDNINTLVLTLNRLGQELNLSVEDYNTIGQSRGDEFEEGVYVQSGKDKHIDIYEFSDQNKLIRVLSHELGHALGLSHVDDPDAIMYKLNQSKNDKLTSADLAELRQVCNIN